MADENFKKELGSNLDQLSKSLMANSEISQTLQELNVTVNDRFDQVDEKIDDFLDLNDGGTTTFSPIKTMQEDTMTGDNKRVIDDSPDFVEIKNEESEGEGNDQNIDKMDIAVSDIDNNEEINTTEPPVINIEIPEQNNDNLDELSNSISDLDSPNIVNEITNITNNPTAPIEVPFENTEITNTENNQLTNVNDQTSNNIFNEITSQNDDIQNTVNNIEQDNMETPSVASPQVTPNVVFTENQFLEQNSNSIFEELTSPSTTSDAIFNDDIQNQEFSGSPTLSGVDIQNATMEERERLVELVKNEETNFQEITNIKNDIINRDTQQQQIEFGNVRDDVNTSLNTQEVPNVPLDTKIEVNATLGNDASEMLGKMLRQLVKLNSKFDEVFGE